MSQKNKLARALTIVLESRCIVLERRNFKVQLEERSPPASRNSKLPVLAEKITRRSQKSLGYSGWKLQAPSPATE